MTTPLVLTITSRDRPGLVEMLSQAVVEHGGNWLESRMSRLAGRFAGILLITVPTAGYQPLVQALENLKSQGLDITVEETTEQALGGDYRTLQLDLIGQDHPGIIYDISKSLNDQGILVEDLTTECISGSMSGENLFKATAFLRVPNALSTEKLRFGLEGLADELMVDINLEDPPTTL